ncbi:MAG: ABC transporter permease, partial [Deltaproteobacteria bacterium]|nr:ABC transporter permease [Deltaproteobacteria bacterium]
MTFVRIFSVRRLWAMIIKEFRQMRRDRVTFAMMICIPLMQLILFGFAINSDPKNLPTAVLTADNSPFSRSIIAALQNSLYFKLVKQLTSETEAQRLLTLGQVQFVLNIPV